MSTDQPTTQGTRGTRSTTRELVAGPRSPERHSSSTSPPQPWRTGLLVAAVAVVADLVIYGAVRLAGTSFLVSTGGRPPMEVGPLLIIGNVLVAVLVGAGLLALAARRSDRAWQVLGWIGLGFGLVSIVAPLGADGDVAARTALGSMHLVTGLVWWIGLRRRAPGAVR